MLNYSLLFYFKQVKTYSIDTYNYTIKVYGISQNPDTKDYIIVLQNTYCKMFSTSGNRKVDDLIQTMQLKRQSHYDITFEWIPYNQFGNVEEISKGDVAIIYSAIWNNGPLNYDSYKSEYTRKSDKAIILKCIHNSQNITNEFFNEV